jgi:triosephosphate isomerase (TIM)
MKPLILINFKTYKESLGNRGLILAKEIAKVKRPSYEIAVAPTLLTIKEIAAKTKLPVYSQHVDPITDGSHTGRISLKELKQAGVSGTILNHSERKLPFSLLKETVKMCKEKNMKVVICASSLSETKKMATLQPTYLAYEPAALIGGNISVTNSKPDIIVKAVELVKSVSPKTKVLVGAGVHSQEDIGQALLLGTQGVLIGHAIPKARDPKKFLEKILL